MEKSSNNQADKISEQHEIAQAKAIEPAEFERDSISVTRWFAIFFAVLFSAIALLWMNLKNSPIVTDSYDEFKESVKLASPGVKLLIFGIYQTIACTFVPLYTGWIVSAMALQSVALTSSEWSTVLLVALVGATASTLANLNDYHIFTLALRSKRVAKIRNTRMYIWAQNHFQQAPFLITLLFNVAPIPVDVSRLVAAINRYNRGHFAVANFAGRFIRYTIIADITYRAGEVGWVVPVVLLAIATLIPLIKFLLRKLKNTSLNASNNA